MAAGIIPEGWTGLLGEVVCFRFSRFRRIHVSFAVIEDELRDWVGRPIRHTLGLVMPVSDGHEREVVLNWHVNVWPSLSGVYQRLHGADRDGEGTTNARPDKIAENLQRSLGSSIAVPGDTVVLPVVDLEVA